MLSSWPCLTQPTRKDSIDEAAFAALKPGAVLVNIARGQVIDQDALTRRLQSGQVAFAALDPFAVEPLDPNSPLWDLPNVLISPHSASTVESENRKITDIFCHNLRCYTEGRRDDMKNVLDKGPNVLKESKTPFVLPPALQARVQRFLERVTDQIGREDE